MIIRCLAAQLEPTHPLMYYFNREDFWDVGMGEKLDSFEAILPGDINLDHSLCTYEVIDELN